MSNTVFPAPFQGEDAAKLRLLSNDLAGEKLHELSQLIFFAGMDQYEFYQNLIKRINDSKKAIELLGKHFPEMKRSDLTPQEEEYQRTEMYVAAMRKLGYFGFSYYGRADILRVWNEGDYETEFYEPLSERELNTVADLLDTYLQKHGGHLEDLTIAEKIDEVLSQR